MRRLLHHLVAVAVLGMGFAVTARAHHSFAMFDPDKLVTLTGTVKEFQWTAPHALLWLVADQDDAAAGDNAGKLWSIELSTSPGPLTRLGWTKHSLVPGDAVRVDINPLRSGEPGGSFKKLTILKTGQVLTTAPPSPAP
jgi:hypothetical protein